MGSRGSRTGSTATRAWPRSCSGICSESFPRSGAGGREVLTHGAPTCNASQMRFEADLEAARARIADAVVRTPVWRSDALEEALGCSVWLMCERDEPSGSAELRG